MKACWTALALAVTLAAVASTQAGGAHRPLRVGYLEWSTGGGSGEDLRNGYAKALRRFGLEGTVRDVGPRDTVNDGIAYFVRQKYDLVVLATPNPGIVQFVDAAVKRFPTTRFLLPDVTPLQHPAQWRNVHAYGFRVEQAAYLAGYLGGIVEKQRNGRHVVSSVGGYPEPQLDPFIASYQAGAHRADPNVTTLLGYSYDFSAPAKCRSVALGQIARHSGVLFDIAGSCGLGALQAAREHGIWGIGVDVDESSLGPFILTSVLKRQGRALYLELSAFAHGTLSPGGFTWFGLHDHAVGLGKISPRVSESQRRQLAAVEAAVASGKVAVPAGLR